MTYASPTLHKRATQGASEGFIIGLLVLMAFAAFRELVYAFMYDHGQLVAITGWMAVFVLGTSMYRIARGGR